MNIQPNAATAAIAGTERAAARGGESDAKRSEANRQKSVAESPDGKAADSSEVDSGQETADRGGDGRQVLDVFQRSEDSQDETDQESDQQTQSTNADGQGNHLDLEA